MTARLLLSLLPALASAAAAQPVEEGVHRDRVGPPSLCGLTGGSIEDIRRQLIAGPGIEEVAGGDLYYAYLQNEPMRAWAFTRPSHPAHPAVVCREMQRSGGDINIVMSISCDSSRASCDQLYRDFQSLNEGMKEEIAGRIR